MQSLGSKQLADEHWVHGGRSSELPLLAQTQAGLEGTKHAIVSVLCLNVSQPNLEVSLCLSSGAAGILGAKLLVRQAPGLHFESALVCLRASTEGRLPALTRTGWEADVRSKLTSCRLPCGVLVGAVRCCQLLPGQQACLEGLSISALHPFAPEELQAFAGTRIATHLHTLLLKGHCWLF